MSVPARLDSYIETDKQRHFSRDFLAGWTEYETWEQARVGEVAPAQRTFELLQHPIFVTTIGFYTVGERGIGTWMRTPGARNPGQRIEIFEPFRYGDTITTTVTTQDKFVQRGKPYIQMLLDFRNQADVLKARWWCSLILPATRSDVARFANA